MKNSHNFKAPAYWLTWVGVFLLRIVSKLPFRSGILLGQMIGSALYYLIPKRRRVAEVNVKLCFPELSADEQHLFVKNVFRNNGVGIIETAWAYWGRPQTFAKRIEFQGFQHLEQALLKGKGVILLGAHYSHLDLGGLLFSLYGKPLYTMYRQHNNPLMEKVIKDGRSRFCTPVERKKLRDIVKLLRKNQIVWYAPDQDFGNKSSVFVPFFGQTAATVTATSKLVSFNDSPILSLQQRRKPDNTGYTLEIVPIPAFPTGDETEDARLINLAIEEGVRKVPEQYMWVHKRFKTQPDGEQKLYRRAGC